jgi:L-fuculose-phosphate aldolase
MTSGHHDSTPGPTSRAALVDAYRRMLDAGLIQGTAGNVSIRTERGMVITPSSLDPAVMTENDLCAFDFESGLIGDDKVPSTEWLLHLRVYLRTTAGAIIHTHSLAATAVSLVGNQLPAVHYYIVRLGGPIRVVTYATYGSEELAESVGEALQDRQAVILQNHGTVTIGRTLDEAYDRATLLEWLCELYLKAAGIGDPHVLSADELAAVRAQGARITARGYRPG